MPACASIMANNIPDGPAPTTKLFLIAPDPRSLILEARMLWVCDAEFAQCHEAVIVCGKWGLVANSGQVHTVCATSMAPTCTLHRCSYICRESEEAKVDPLCTAWGGSEEQASLLCGVGLETEMVVRAASIE